MLSLSDEKIVKSCIEKNLHCQVIFERYKNLVAAIIWNNCGDAELTKDLTQETFLKVYKNLNQFQGKASLKTWITQIARRVCIDHVRKSKVRKAEKHVSTTPEDGDTPIELPEDQDISDSEMLLLKKEKMGN